MTDSQPYLQRYLNGEHEQVWDELVALGAAVRDEPVYSDAVAVARETMRRARQNIEMLIPRLASIGYQFGYGWIQPPSKEEFSWENRKHYGEHLQWARSEPPIVSFVSDREEEIEYRTRRLAKLRELGAPRIILENDERKLDDLQTSSDTLIAFERSVGTLPVSVKAWYEVFGSVNFVGIHFGWLERLGFSEPMWGLDEGGSPVSCLQPLYVYPMDASRIGRIHEDGTKRTTFYGLIPNEFAAYGCWGQDSWAYEIELPCLAADTVVRRGDTHTTFVAYLRECFRWGGFPGWARLDNRPEQDIAYLTAGLLPL